MDALAEDYLAWSTYNYTLGNPILFIDPDGRYVDLSNLTESEREAYEAQIKKLSENQIFTAYYNRLQNSETTYYIKIGIGEGGSGSFKPETKEVFATDDPSVIAEELFHAFQEDLGVYDQDDFSVRETEGDLLAVNIGISIEDITKSNTWDQGIGFNSNYTDENLIFNEGILTEEFDNDFTNAVDARIEAYRFREKSTGAKAPAGYIQPNSGKKALALKKAVREAGALDLAGPRLPNGDYFSN